MRGIKPLLALAVLSLLGPAVASAVTYTGSLDYSPFSYHDDLRIHGRQWPWYDLEFSWNVTDEDASHPAFPWRYDYRLKVRNPWPWGSLKGPINYVIIELSPGVTMDDITGVRGAGVGPAAVGWHPAGPDNPNMPEDLYGIRFERTGASYDMSWSFYANRNPVWGDFYAHNCGNSPANTAFNWHDPCHDPEEGFVPSDTDPLAPPSAGDGCNHYFHHILRPDREGPAPSPIPEPLTMVGVFAGAACVAGRVIRRRRT